LPYVSRAQQGFAHTPAARAKGFPTAEFDAASKGQKGLPEHAAKKKPVRRKKRPTRFPAPSGGSPFGGGGGMKGGY
jgi:hypothetical protein